MEIINPSGKKTFKLETDFCGRKLGLEVNRVGFRTTSSVLVTYGDTVVLGSVVVGTKPVVQDFFRKLRQALSPGAFNFPGDLRHVDVDQDFSGHEITPLIDADFPMVQAVGIVPQAVRG